MPVMDEVMETGTRVAGKAREISEQMSEKMKEGVAATGKALRHSRESMEDLLDEARIRARRHPLRTAGVAAIVGFTFGVVVGIIAGRATKD